MYFVHKCTIWEKIYEGAHLYSTQHWLRQLRGQSLESSETLITHKLDSWYLLLAGNLAETAGWNIYIWHFHVS